MSGELCIFTFFCKDHSSLFLDKTKQDNVKVKCIKDTLEGLWMLKITTVEMKIADIGKNKSKMNIRQDNGQELLHC